MRSKKSIQNLFFLGIIAILLIVPMGYWLSLNGHWNGYSETEERKYASFPSVSLHDLKTASKRVYQGLYREAGEIFFNRFIHRDFFKKVETAAAEQIPLRFPLLNLSRGFERAVIGSIYAFLPDQVYPASMASEILYVDRTQSSLMEQVEQFGDKQKAVEDERIAIYKEYLKKYPAVNFYVYNIETLPYSPYHPMARYFPTADDGRSLQYFMENKPAGLRVEIYALNSLKDYQDRFFGTDHHWNIRASEEGYQQIYGMVAEKYADISPMLQDWPIKTVPGAEFLGTYARKSLYPIRPDPLEYADIDVGPYTTYLDGVEGVYSKRESYLKNDFDHSKYVNHYGKFFGDPKLIIRYKFENNSQRNLLMVASSYSRTIQLYLASHFHNTYVIDPRYEQNRAETMGQFIQQYKITDVLVIGQPDVTYLSMSRAIQP